MEKGEHNTKKEEAKQDKGHGGTLDEGSYRGAQRERGRRGRGPWH